MLMDGRMVYYLFPRTRNPIRLSPLQVLLGETSNGDVARTGFAKDYDVTALTETVGRARPATSSSWMRSGQEGLDLREGRRSGWRRPSLRPVYAEFSAADGKLLKKAYTRTTGQSKARTFPSPLTSRTARPAEAHDDDLY